LGCPKDFITLVLFTWWFRFGDVGSEWDIIEIFAGCSRIAKFGARVGLATRAVEIDFDSKRKSSTSGRKRRSYMDINGEAGFALCVHLLLHGKWGSLLVVLAIVCSTWSSVNQHTSGRDILVPYGTTYYPSVRSGNKMTSRSALLILLISCMEAVFMIENPGGSSICHHPRLHWVLTKLRELGLPVFKCKFWMIKFGTSTPKPTMVLSTSKAISALYLGELSPQERATDENTSLTDKYIDSHGRSRYKGNKRLKQSQRYSPAFARATVSLIPKMRSERRATLPHDDSLDVKVQFQHCEWSSWEEAEVIDVLLYLRKSSKLVVPLEWDNAVPSLEDLMRIDASL